MTETTAREETLTTTFEQVAADLRDGSATLYGYDVRTGPRLRECGGVSSTVGWLSFELTGRHSQRTHHDDGAAADVSIE